MSAGATPRSLTCATQQSSSGWSLTRERAFPALAVVVIAASAGVRMPIGLPGHRGLIWLTFLVAVALVCRRPETVVAVGAASTSTALLLNSAPDAWGSARYLAAAVLLYALTAAPVIGGRRWLIALSAAPIHLVALAGSVTGLLSGGYLVVLASAGMTQKVLCHLAFGLLAGLLGWAIASAVDCCTSAHLTEAS